MDRLISTILKGIISHHINYIVFYIPHRCLSLSTLFKRNTTGRTCLYVNVVINCFQKRKTIKAYLVFVLGHTIVIDSTK